MASTKITNVSAAPLLLREYGNLTLQPRAYITVSDDLATATKKVRSSVAIESVSIAEVKATQAFSGAEPLDSDLVAGQFAFWFDSTVNATKLRVKAKDADGMVVVGTLTLSEVLRYSMAEIAAPDVELDETKTP